MSDDTDNTYQARESQEAQADQSPDDSIPQSARPLCPNCLTPCDPLVNYCPNCGSNEVINPFASYMPVVNIRFWCGFFGKAWRKIWHDKNTPLWLQLICLITTAVCAPYLLVAGSVASLTGKISSPRLRTITIAVFCLAAILLVVVLLIT